MQKGKTFDPEEHNMAFCPVCNGKGKLAKNPGGFNVCRTCGGFGLVTNQSIIVWTPRLSRPAVRAERVEA
jgi:DnaJ-class molecular chaperone